MCVTSAKNIWIHKLFLHVCCFLHFDRASVRFLFWAALGSYKRGFVKWCCWGTLIGGMRYYFVKKLWFLELPDWKRVPIDDLGALKLLPILDFETLATNEVSHFSGLFLTFLFMKWGKMDKTLVIYFSTKKWPHMHPHKISMFFLLFWFFSWRRKNQFF